MEPRSLAARHIGVSRGVAAAQPLYVRRREPYPRDNGARTGGGHDNVRGRRDGHPQGRTPTARACPHTGGYGRGAARYICAAVLSVRCRRNNTRSSAYGLGQSRVHDALLVPSISVEVARRIGTSGRGDGHGASRRCFRNVGHFRQRSRDGGALFPQHGGRPRHRRTV
ncbi:unknown [Prevotella sp. CAG:1124]|nr:unknown [Prevotella sp. CAG:1124]